MNLIEHNRALRELRQEYNNRARRLVSGYLEEHNPIKVGDIVEDHYKRIRVEGWKVYYAKYEMQGIGGYIVYRGTRLTRGGDKMKKGASDNEMYAYNIEAINGESVDIKKVFGCTDADYEIVVKEMEEKLAEMRAASTLI